jgi:hypothetical protein
MTDHRLNARVQPQALQCATILYVVGYLGDGRSLKEMKAAWKNDRGRDKTHIRP